MADVLKSYVAGSWIAPDGDSVPLVNAVTGEEVARFPSASLDAAAVIDYGRGVGGPALRALTFHQRASALKSLGKLLMSRKEEFYPLSAATGATTRDSAIDIDGGIGTLLSYASKGTRELPNDTVYLDGSIETAGPRRHIRRPAHLHLPPRRRRPDQCVQLPGVGDVGETGSGVYCRSALDRQAGTSNRLLDRAGLPRHHRLWVTA